MLFFIEKKMSLEKWQFLNSIFEKCTSADGYCSSDLMNMCCRKGLLGQCRLYFIVSNYKCQCTKFKVFLVLFLKIWVILNVFHSPGNKYESILLVFDHISLCAYLWVYTVFQCVLGGGHVFVSPWHLLALCHPLPSSSSPVLPWTPLHPPWCQPPKITLVIKEHVHSKMLSKGSYWQQLIFYIESSLSKIAKWMLCIESFLGLKIKKGRQRLIKRHSGKCTNSLTEAEIDVAGYGTFTSSQRFIRKCI